MKQKDISERGISTAGGGSTSRESGGEERHSCGDALHGSHGEPEVTGTTGHANGNVQRSDMVASNKRTAKWTCLVES